MWLFKNHFKSENSSYGEIQMSGNSALLNINCIHGGY